MHTPVLSAIIPSIYNMVYISNGSKGVYDGSSEHLLTVHKELLQIFLIKKLNFFENSVDISQKYCYYMQAVQNGRGQLLCNSFQTYISERNPKRLTGTFNSVNL